MGARGGGRRQLGAGAGAGPARPAQPPVSRPRRAGLRRPSAQPGLASGYPELRLRAAHPERRGPLPASRPLFPLPGSTGSHTPPSAVPAPRHCIARRARVPSPERSPRPPKFLPARPPCRPPLVPPRQSDATRWKLTSTLGRKIEPSWENLKAEHPTEIKTRPAAPSQGRPGRGRLQGACAGSRRVRGGVAPTSARAWARYPQPRSSRQAQVLIASRGAGGSARRRGRGAGTPAGLLWRRDSVPSLRERGPEGGAARRAGGARPARAASAEEAARRGGGAGVRARRAGILLGRR